MRKLKFKPSHNDTLRANDRAIRHLALLSGREAPPEFLNNLPPKKERAAPRKLEAPVIKSISELLAVHPDIIWAARINSGAAGEHSQVKFHWFVRKPYDMRMPDFFGMYRHSYTEDRGWKISPIAIEGKAPGWTKPRDERERCQAMFLAVIRDAGGIGIFATSVEEVAAALA